MGEIKTELLIERCREGNEEAFGELVTLYQNKVYTMCMHLAGNPEDAKDLAQEAFIRVYHALPGFRGQSAFTTWLYRIVFNLWSNELRKRKKNYTVSLDSPIHTEGGEIQRTPADEKQNPELLLEAMEERRLVWQALDSLNQEQRTVLVLREMHGYSYDEMARGLGWSPGTVKSRLNRARIQLKEHLIKISSGNSQKGPKQPAGGSRRKV